MSLVLAMCLVISNRDGIGNTLGNETVFHGGGTWYLDRWIPGTGMIMNYDQECAGNTRECVALLSRTVLTNLRIIRTQDWQNTEDSLAKIDGLSILAEGWQSKDRLCEGKILKQPDGQSRNGKRKRGTSGWWWPTISTASTSRNRAKWPSRSKVYI